METINHRWQMNLLCEVFTRAIGREDAYVYRLDLTAVPEDDEAAAEEPLAGLPAGASPAKRVSASALQT